MLTNDGKCTIESIWAKIEASRCDEERQFWRSELKQKWPGMICGGADEPEWDKRDLVNLYEDINFRGNLQGTKLLPEELTPEFKEFKQLPSYYTEVRRSTFVHTTYNGQVVNSENEVRTEETLYWMCISTEDLRDQMVRVGRKRQKMDKDHFGPCNWSMPLLLGSQHSNRFKRNTKVYVLFGVDKGRHGVVIGHQIAFNLKDWGSPEGKSPVLKVLMVCRETGYLEVRDVHQDLVKLVDLHNRLPFGVPRLRLFDYPDMAAQLERRIETHTNGLIPPTLVSRNFWALEMDNYWDYERNSVTRRNSGN